MAAPPSSPAPDWLIYAIVGGFVVVFPILWCGIVWLISRVSGWHRLAQSFRVTEDLGRNGEVHSGVTGMVGGASYKGVLKVQFARDGFYLGVMALFRVGHPPLFIPWAAVSSRETRQLLWWKSVKLGIGSPVIATVTLPEPLLSGRLPSAASSATGNRV